MEGEDVEQEGRLIRRPGNTIRASLHSRNAHGHLTRAIVCGNLQEKYRTPIPDTAFCASLRSRNAHGHLKRTILCQNLQEKCRAPIPRHIFCASLRSRNAHGHFTRAMHFVWKFTGKMPEAHENTSIKHRALTVTVRTPSVWPHCLGNNRKQHTLLFFFFLLLLIMMIIIMMIIIITTTIIIIIIISNPISS